MTIKRKDIRNFVSFAMTVATGAGRILRQGFRRPLTVKYKGRIDPVTQYDLKSERYIVESIARLFPDHSILSEEGRDKDVPGGFCWVIDPLDGTVNYAHRFPVYCVSIALQFEGTTIAAAVYDPERDELFSAGTGLGAKLNGQHVLVSGERRLDRALLATGFAYDIGSAKRNNFGLFARMAKRAQGVRRPGSAAIDLCWLSCGRLDGFWELYLHPWDTAAAILIVSEAGGKVSRLDGSTYSIFDKDIMASNGRIHSAMGQILTGKHVSG